MALSARVYWMAATQKTGPPWLLGNPVKRERSESCRASAQAGTDTVGWRVAPLGRMASARRCCLSAAGTRAGARVVSVRREGRKRSPRTPPSRPEGPERPEPPRTSIAGSDGIPRRRERVAVSARRLSGPVDELGSRSRLAAPARLRSRGLQCWETRKQASRSGVYALGRARRRAWWAAARPDRMIVL